MITVELRHLRYFKAVADRLSFTAAARHLGIAQPPLSTQIRNLEREIGSPLFTRSRRAVLLTPAGRSLLMAANEILARADAAVLEIQDEAAGRAGTLRVAADPARISERVTRRIRKFLRRNRGVRFHLVPLPTDPSGADVSLRDLPTSLCPAGAISLEVSSIQVVMNSKHRLAERTDVRLSDLFGEALLTSPNDPSAAEPVVRAALDRGGVTAQHRSETQDCFWAASLGLGLALAAAHTVIPWEVVRLPLSELTETITLAAIPHPAATSLALPAFLDALRPD